MAPFSIPRGGTGDIVFGEVPAGEEAHYLKFVCPPTFSGGPFDRQPPTRRIRRKLDASMSLPLPAAVASRTRAGRNDITLWVIEDPDSRNGRTFPSPIIRTVQGDIVHAEVGFKRNAHTIHWHGIEPSPLNDGVGHTSFEATSSFVYQFATREAGTYFYHCHKNTVLHVEMGMYGALVVDPRNPDPGDTLQAPYRTGGPGFVAANLSGFPGFRFDPEHFVARYDVEAIWVADECDSVWHELGHDAFMQDCDERDPVARGSFTQDGILNDFRPDVFVVSGVVSVPTTAAGIRPEVGATIRDPRVAVTARVGDTILVRLVNAGYTIHEYGFEGLDALVVAADGHPFGVPPFATYSSPFVIPAGTPFRLSSARRLDILLRPRSAGQFPFTVRYYDWLNGPDSPSPKQFHIARTRITIV